MNAFETGQRKAIPAVLVYVRKSDEILMIHRVSKQSDRIDDHQGKWNGLGGKCEADESPLEAAQREVQEESGLELTQNELKPLGVIHFPNFKPHKNEDWIVYVFTADLPKDKEIQINHSSLEGDLHWISIQKITSLNLWPGDTLFIPLVFDETPFMGTIWYHQGKVDRHWIQKLDLRNAARERD